MAKRAEQEQFALEAAEAWKREPDYQREIATLQAEQEALREVVGTAIRRLKVAAALHSGDEHPVLETAMLDVANILLEALSAESRYPPSGETP